MPDERRLNRKIDTGSNDILAEVGDGIATITLNRPERRNAMSRPMLGGLARLLAEFEADPDVAVVVLTGAGGAFCAGGDVKDFNERGGAGGSAGTLDPQRVDQQRALQRATVGRMYTYSKPVLASLPGAAAGAGLGLALSADLRIGTPRTVMVTAFVGVALSGDFGTTWLLDKLVGPAKTRELMWLSPKLHADECLRIGLINWIVPDEELQTKTREIARTLARGPRGCIANMKRNFVKARCDDLCSSMDLEVQLHLECGVTDDHREAVAAFVEKRTPVFRYK